MAFKSESELIELDEKLRKTELTEDTDLGKEGLVYDDFDQVILSNIIDLNNKS